MTAPTILVTDLPAQLCPANHRMVRIQPTVTVSDEVDPAPVVTLVITSDERDTGVCDGDLRGDIRLRTPTDFDLRAERSNKGNGRTYTLVWTATDASGNSTTLTTTVEVPKNPGTCRGMSKCWWTKTIHHGHKHRHGSHRKGRSDHR
jgi:hypothetical protein